jgi:hypothetical protein
VPTSDRQRLNAVLALFEPGYAPYMMLTQYIDVHLLVFAAFVTTSSWMVSVEVVFGITAFRRMLPSIKKQQNILKKKGTCQRLI